MMVLMRKLCTVRCAHLGNQKFAACFFACFF